MAFANLTHAAARRFPRLQTVAWRLLWQGTPPGHYYSPIASTSECELGRAAAVAATFDPHSSAGLQGIDLRPAAQLELWRSIVEVAKEYRFPRSPDGSSRYYRDNHYYTDPDALTLFCLVRYLQPRRVIEVGAGFSSALILDTIEQNSGQRSRCTFIDPFPDRLHALVPKLPSHAEVIPRRVQDVPLSLFADLAAGDILLIDSSHVLKHNSDLCYLLFEVLPRLASGVLIHFHDVCFPFEYPRHWLKAGRAWNEAYALRCFLMHNQRFDITLWNHYLGLAFPECLQDLAGVFDPGDGCSLWITKRS